MKNRAAATIAIAAIALITLASSASAVTITVNSNGDSEANNGFCTLREAIRAANEDFWAFDSAGECADGSGTDTISFVAGFDGDGDATNRITLTADSAFDPIIQPVTINGGDCDAGAAAKPCVHVDANGSGVQLTGETAFDVQSPDVTIRGFAITDADDLPSAAIKGNGSPRLTVRNNWFGIKLDGTSEPNTTGVLVLGDDATIGGTSASDRNVFGRAELTALNIFGAANTTVQGNYFGTGPDGATTAGFDSFRTIQVLGSALFGAPTGTLIGGPESGVPGTCEAPCNVIASPNAAIGLNSFDPDLLESVGTRIEGNFVGLSATGTLLAGGGSINVGGADDVTIGGDASRRNYLGEVRAIEGATGLDIDSNFVGLNPAGTARVRDGLIHLGEFNEQVAGASITRNRIARGPGGLSAIQATITGSVIQGNTIGVGTGNQNVGGGSSAISLPGSGSGTLVGGSALGEGNVIGHTGTAIVSNEPNATIIGNFIGTDPTETQAYPIGDRGIFVVGGNNTQVGGTTAASENVFANISGATDGDAIKLSGNGTDFIRVLRNRGSAAAGREFVDLFGADGPGNNATGPNESIERPTITAGATSKQVNGTGALPDAVVRVYTTASTSGATGPSDIVAYAGQTVADGSGNWTLECPSAGCEVGLPGAGEVTANQTATTGSSSEMADPKAYTDLEPDTTTTSGPPSGGATNDSTPTFVFVASEPGATFQCKVDGDAFAACSGPGASHTTGALTEGDHTFQVQATDNTAHPDPSPASTTFKVDLTAPETQIDSGPAAGETITDPAASFGFSASEVGSTFECRIDAGAFAACSGPGAAHTEAGLSEGAHTFAVRATDPAGNADASPAARAFTVDVPDPPEPPTTPTPQPPPPSAGDTDPPETTIDKAPKRKSAKRKAKFAFSSDEPEARL